jgi:hypothetical protein
MNTYNSLVAKGLKGPLPDGANGLGGSEAVVGHQHLLNRVVTAILGHEIRDTRIERGRTHCNVTNTKISR